MTEHRTAALTAAFLDYALKTSPTGQYYVFNVMTQEGSTDICRMDAIHRRVAEKLFEQLDKGEQPVGPVIRDIKHGYRIDLSAVHDFFGTPEGTKPRKPRTARNGSGAPPATGVKRAQFSISEDTYEAMCRLSAAEGYATYTDWLRALIERVLAAPLGEGE